MSLAHPFLFLIAATMAIGILLHRRRRLLRAIAAICLAIAAGGPFFMARPAGVVDVMVDMSPSTRGATFRSRAVLQHRVSELADKCPVRWIQFADDSKPLAVDSTPDAIPEIPSQRTQLSCDGHNPVLLFSDGNFTQVNVSSPVFPVIDPNLEDPQDSSVQSITVSGEKSNTTVMNNHAGNLLHWNLGPPRELPTGRSIITATTKSDQLTASIEGHDRWPENDSLTVFPPSPNRLQRWWVGGDLPPAGFVAIGPAAFPLEARALLGVSVVVLNNLPANALEQNQQAALSDYVHRFGGVVLIIMSDPIAGDRGTNRAIQQLSPLSLDPPTPQRRWTVLLDRSGSMAVETNGSSRYQQSAMAAAELAEALPPADLISVGVFANSFSWIACDANANAAAAALKLAAQRPADGPTNLEATLEDIVAQSNGELPKQLFIFSDGQAQIDDPTALASRLTAAHIKLTLLDRAWDQPDAAVKQLVAHSDGKLINDDEAIARATQIIRQSATTRRQNTQPATVHFDSSLQLPPRIIAAWQPCWLTHDAIALTDDIGPIAARWPVGWGTVFAMNFKPSDQELNTLQEQMVSQPNDPAEHIEWLDRNPLTVDVFTSGTSRLSLILGNDPPLPFSPIAPGEFEVVTTAPASPVAAVVVDGSALIGRRVLAGRYSIEFDRIGNDRLALQQLADETGGKLILPNQRSPIDFRWPIRSHSLAAWFAATGAIALAVECFIKRT